MLETVKPLLQWFEALERRMKALEADVKVLNADLLIRDFEQTLADLGIAPAPKTASKPSRTVGLSNIPRRPAKRGRPARA